MEQRTGEILSDQQLEERLKNLTDEEKTAIKAQFDRLTPAEYDKYSKLPERERPVAKAFDQYLSKKKRYHEPRTQRQAFYAGFAAAQKLYALKDESDTDGLKKQYDDLLSKAKDKNRKAVEVDGEKVGS